MWNNLGFVHFRQGPQVLQPARRAGDVGRAPAQRWEGGTELGRVMTRMDSLRFGTRGAYTLVAHHGEGVGFSHVSNRRSRRDWQQKSTRNNLFTIVRQPTPVWCYESV